MIDHSSCNHGLATGLSSEMGTALSSLAIGALTPVLLAQPQRHVPFGVHLLASSVVMRWLPADPACGLNYFDGWANEACEGGHALIVARFARSGHLSFVIVVPQAGRIRMAQAMPHISSIDQLAFAEADMTSLDEFWPYFPDEPRLPAIAGLGISLMLGMNGWVGTSAQFLRQCGSSADGFRIAHERLTRIEPVLHLLAARGGLK